ncbi:MAG: HDOD domain-containing protein [bacterium]
MNSPLVSREQISADLQSVPLLSPSASQVLRLANDPDSAVADIARVVEVDSALTAHILRVVNSAAFSLVQKVESLDRAISYLGRSVIAGIAIGYSSASVFDKPLEGYESERGDLWAYSLRSAIASRELAKLVRNLSPELGYTAGLLHDIGKSIVSRHLKGSAERILASIDSGEAGDYLDAERELLGTDHCEVGAELAELWGLPDSLREAIRRHHRPAAAPEAYRALVYCVHLGDIVSMMGGAGTGSDAMGYTLDPGYAAYVEISNSDLTQLWLMVESEYARTKSAVFGDGGEEA